MLSTNKLVDVQRNILPADAPRLQKSVTETRRWGTPHRRYVVK
jgi:hypothetical protein